MKVLVATSRTQGARSDDYNWCIDGELVWIQEPCACDRAGCHTCGCGRGFAGLTSHRATTTAEVKDIDGFTREDYVLALRTSLSDGGWPAEWAEDIATDQIRFGADWPDRTILERHLDVFTKRTQLRQV